MRRDAVWRVAASAALLLAVALAPSPVSGAAAGAQGPGTPRVRVMVRPPVVKLGEPALYRVEVIGADPRSLEWMRPDSGSAFTWGEPRRGAREGRDRQRPRFGADARSGKVVEGAPDTAWVEIPLQAFELGSVPIPGLGFTYRPGGDPRQLITGRAPTSRIVVAPVLTAADSNATLRPVHGPLAAPWWERVPWLWVLAALLALALAVASFLAWRKRRRRGPLAAPVLPLTASEAALAALAELRALDLPRQSRFAEHAFRLGQILRRYLEATVTTTQPGDTTPELTRHLSEAGLSDEDVRRLAGLLRVWDRVKFAREPFTADEAGRAEIAVEGFVRRAATRPSAEAA